MISNLSRFSSVAEQLAVDECRNQCVPGASLGIGKDFFRGLKKKFFFSEKERKRRVELVNFVKSDLEQKLSSLGGILEIHGSFSKGTELKSSDVDFFMLFPKTEDLFKKYAAIKRKVSKIYVVQKEAFVEHPYLTFEYEQVLFDIVPCHVFTGQISSSVDRSPEHTKYFLAHSTNKHKDLIRFLKLFFKTTGCFGKYISGGVTGYFLECLVLFVDPCCFFKLISSISSWVLPKVFSGKQVDSAPLTFLDPVDPSRNISACISEAIASRLVLVSKFFLKAPTKKLFFGIGVHKEILKNKNFLESLSVHVFVKKKTTSLEKKIQKEHKFLRTIEKELKKKKIPVFYTGIEEIDSKIFLFFLSFPFQKQVYSASFTQEQEYFEKAKGLFLFTGKELVVLKKNTFFYSSFLKKFTPQEGYSFFCTYPTLFLKIFLLK